MSSLLDQAEERVRSKAAVSPEEMKKLAKNYFARHKKDPFGSTWIISSTVLLVAAEFLERWDRKEKRECSND